MDPTTAQYATLAANLGLAGFMAVMLVTWNKQANDKSDKDRTEREKAAKLDAGKCKACMEQQHNDMQAMLDRVIEVAANSNRFMESLANKDNNQRRLDQIEKMLRSGKHGGSDDR